MARYVGTVTFYNARKGFGSITLKQEGVVPNDLVYVKWREIKSDDQYPLLVCGMEIELSIMKWKEKSSWGGGRITLHAKHVTAIGGGDIGQGPRLDHSEGRARGAKIPERWGFRQPTWEERIAEDQRPKSPGPFLSYDSMAKKLSKMQENMQQAMRDEAAKANAKFDLIFSVCAELQRGQSKMEETIKSLKAKLESQGASSAPRCAMPMMQAPMQPIVYYVAAPQQGQWHMGFRCGG